MNKNLKQFIYLFLTCISGSLLCNVFPSFTREIMFISGFVAAMTFDYLEDVK